MLPLRRPTIYSSIYAALPTDRPVVWTLAERLRLEEMKRRWGVHRDTLTEAELRRACFCCWLLARGRRGRG